MDYSNIEEIIRSLENALPGILCETKITIKDPEKFILYEAISICLLGSIYKKELYEFKLITWASEVKRMDYVISDSIWEHW